MLYAIQQDVYVVVAAEHAVRMCTAAVHAVRMHHVLLIYNYVRCMHTVSSSSSLAFFAYRSACTNMQMHVYIIYIHNTFKHSAPSAARITRIGQTFKEYLQV